MNNTKQYYKVVDEYRAGYYSTYAGCALRTEYFLNIWSTATIGGLLVFDNLESAKQFVTGRPYYRIFKCEVEQPVELPSYRSDSGLWQSNFIAKFWNTNTTREELAWNQEYSMSVEIATWPEHTAAFKRVKLTEQVY